MRDCDQETCPMWDGDTCPCERYGLDPDDLPTNGTFTRAVPNRIEDDYQLPTHQSSTRHAAPA